MSYRDDLGQAHDRIQRLEDELREERAKNARVEPRPASSVKPLMILISVLALVGGALSVIALRGSPQKPLLLKPVDEVLRAQSHYVGMRMRVQGELVRGTVKHRQEPCEFTFFVKGASNLMLPVRYAKCVVPDSFRDTEGLVITTDGTLDESGTFEATQLLVHLAPFPGER